MIVELAHRLHHANVARHLQNLGKINDAIGFLVVVVDRPATNAELTNIIDTTVGLYRLFLQCQSQIDRLKRGSRFVKILNRPLTETSGRKTPIPIGVIRRRRRQHQQLAVGDVHHNRGSLLGLPFGHLSRKRLHR